MNTPRPAARTVLGHGDLGTSLLYIFPLLLGYGIGVLYTPAMNGVDFVSRNLLALLGYDRTRYFLFHLVLFAVFLVVAAWQRRHLTGARRAFLPLLLESTIYALTLGSLVVFVMQRLLGFAPGLALPAFANNVILSLGAGVYEELVFRLGLFAGGAALLGVFGVPRTAALGVAFVVSSVLFSLAHHIGAGGEPFAWTPFVYRTLAGGVFALIFYFRSLAHAVYAHALYDIYVLVLR